VALDVNNYTFYVRDIGVDTTTLTNILQNVINDLATYTKVFKYHFIFDLLPTNKYYDFNALMQMQQRNDKTITTLTLGSNTEDDLLNYLIDPKCSNTNVDVTTGSNTVYDKFLFLDDVQYVGDNSIVSIGSKFKHIREAKYLYTLYDENVKCEENEEPKKAICICTIIPNLEHITDDVESVIRPMIIEGLKYYTDTTENAINVNSDVSQYKKYFNAKNTLMNMYPTRLGRVSKEVMV